ncbi:MAG TPA: hypothetical protein VF615_14345 [Longimicrobiaceae bacterium]
MAAAGLPPVSVPALLTPAGKVLVPLSAVLELTGAPFELDAAAGRASVARPRGQGTARLDVGARTVQAGRRSELGADDAVASGGDLYASATAIALLLEADAEVDEAALRLVLSRDPPFPRQERLSIQERRERELLLGRGGGAAPERPGSVPFHPRSGGGVLEWGVSSLFPDAVLPSHAYGRLGVGVLGGMLQVGASVNVRDPGDPAAGELTGSFLRVFPESPLLRQLRVGDIVTEGLRARSVRGFSVTNAPFARDALFGEAVFAPQLPPGWEYELYQNGRLLGFSDASTANPLSVPLQYGSTPVQVRFYGPAGERVESEVVYLVPVLQIPAGRWQYAAGAGACPDRTECESVGYLDVRHGVTGWLTVLGGTERLADTAGVELRPYGGASIIPAPAWVAEVQGMVRSFARASLQNYGSGRVSGGASGGVTYPGSGTVSFLPTTGPRWYLDTTLRLRLGGVPAVNRSLDLTGRVESPLEGSVDRWRLGAATGVGRLLLETAYESNPTASGDALFLRATAAVTRGVPRWLAAPVVSGAAGVGASGLKQWEVSTTLQPARTILSVTLRGHEDTSPSLVVGSTVRLGFGRAQARGGTRNGRVEGGFSLDGATAFGRGGGLTPLPYGGLGLAGVAGGVFEDDDGDGVRDPGERPVPGVFVSVGGLRTRTGADGRYATWSVLPYEVVQVRVDTTTLPDPSWVPSVPSALLRPSPHVYTGVSFPLVRTRELAGLLLAGDDVPTVGGVTVEIRSLATGAVQRVPTFSDGEYYVGRLRPGEYEVRVAASSLQVLGARAEPEAVRFTVPSSGDEVLVEAPPIQVLKSGS